MTKIAASILSADFSCLRDQVQAAIAAGVDYIHVDIMDGHFVPNMTIGPMIVSAIKPICSAADVPLDVHLMIEKPERLIPDFIKAGSNIITVHVETCPHLNRTIQQIKSLGARAGVTLNPATPLTTLEEILAEVDLVLVMSVNPGFGGQEYIPASTNRIRRLREMLDTTGLASIELEVDGGISPGNAAQIVEAGATVLVSGSGIFNDEASIGDNVAEFRSTLLGVG